MTHLPSTTGPVYDHRCTADERALLDEIAKATDDTEPSDDDVRAVLALVAAQTAVIDATIAETHAETANLHAFRRAANAPRGHHLIDAATTARDRLTAATEARKAAVARLEELRRQ